MVKGVTRMSGDNKMSPQAKVVFAIVIFLAAGSLLFAFFASSTSGETKSALGRQDCRSTFSSKITDANADSLNADAKVRRAQFLGQYYGLVTENDEEFDKSVELGFEGLKDQYAANANLHWYNGQFQQLIAAQKQNPSKFKAMCEAGPKEPPPIPDYEEPPR
jgi:hypothetical protein